MKDTYTKELKLATTIVKTVGLSLVRTQRKVSIAHRKSGSRSFDYTTNQDLLAERTAIRYIKKTFPHDAILSEETLHRLGTIPDRLWVIDPMDGTANYANGMNTSLDAQLGNFTVSSLMGGIALYLDGENRRDKVSSL